MTALQRVIVLAGGTTAEREVSLRSGRRVAAALREAGGALEVLEADMDTSLLGLLSEVAGTCVLPLLHGRAGEDGVVADLLESAGLPFVGSSAAAARLTFDKPVAKTIIARAGLATPDHVVVPLVAFRELGAAQVITLLLARLPLPVVIKPTRGGSSLGVEIVHAAEDLPGAMVRVFAYGDVALIERYVTGQEVAVSIIDDGTGPRALPLVEVVPDREFYDYESRYTAGATEFFCPARLEASVAHAVAESALTAHRALGLRDWSRVDVIVDPTGVPWFLEANIAPGMTETSLVPQAIAATGQHLGEVMLTLVTAAATRDPR